MPKLRSQGLSPAYLQSLRDSGNWLLGLAGEAGWIVSKCRNVRELDRMLEKTVQRAFERGEQLQRVVLGLLSIQRKFRIHGGLLKGSWLAVKGWKALIPTKTRVPITRYLLECVLVMMLNNSAQEQGSERKIWIRCALATWLSFSCLLRPGEALNLRVGDLTFPDISTFNMETADLVVVIKHPKTRRVWKNQFVLCDDVALVQWLSWWISGMSKQKPLFPMSRYIWNSRFNLALSRLCIESAGFTLGSLRCGGATFHFRQHKNLGQLQYHGRWASAETLKHYLHAAMSVHVMESIKMEAKEKIVEVHKHASVLASPPQLSVQNFCL